MRRSALPLLQLVTPATFTRHTTAQVPTGTPCLSVRTPPFGRMHFVLQELLTVLIQPDTLHVSFETVGPKRGAVWFEGGRHLRGVCCLQFHDVQYVATLQLFQRGHRLELVGSAGGTRQCAALVP